MSDQLEHRPGPRVPSLTLIAVLSAFGVLMMLLLGNFASGFLLGLVGSGLAIRRAVALRHTSP